MVLTDFFLGIFTHFPFFLIKPGLHGMLTWKSVCLRVKLKKPAKQPPGGRKSAAKDLVNLIMMGPPTFGWPATLDKVLKKKKKKK